MRKKTYLLCLPTGLLLAALLLAGAIALKHEPQFFRDGTVEPGPERKRASTKFANDLLQLIVNVKNDRDDWHFFFTQGDVNSFLQEDFVSYGEAENLRKLGVSEPRVAFDDGHVRLAFRYGSGFWSTVVSYDLKVWVVPKEANLLAVEIVGRRAGAIPISSHALLKDLTEVASRHNVEVTPYRHEGNPVALIRFQADQPRASAHLKCLRIGGGGVRLVGSTAVCPVHAKDAGPSAAAH